MLRAIPVRWLEDNREWRVKTNLTASGSGVGSGTFNVQRSTFNAQGLPQQNAQNAEGGALAAEKHSRESTEALGWLRATNTAQARNHSGRRKQTQARPLSPGSHLGGAVHLKASGRYSSGG